MASPLIGRQGVAPLDPHDFQDADTDDRQSKGNENLLVNLRHIPTPSTGRGYVRDYTDIRFKIKAAHGRDPHMRVTGRALAAQ